ncbi:MAG: thiol:disulfide interchange protein [Flavobacteriales bacterium]|jgi:thiol:disulfide interchange protein
MTTIRTLTLWFSLFVTLFSLNTYAQFDDNPFGSDEEEFLSFEDAYKVQTHIDGNTVHFDWSIADGYYLYEHQFGLHRVSVTSDEALKFETPEGKVKYDPTFDEELELHYHDVRLSATLPASQDNYQLQITVQGCADAGLCYPPTTLGFDVSGNSISPNETLLPPPELSSTKLSGPEQTGVNEPNSATQTQTSNAEESPFILYMIAGAFLGGLILNLMPCVFPVLSLKALSLANTSENQVAHGWAYTAGIVLSFLSVAAIILIAKSAGNTLGWGFQLQEPVFVAALVYLFFIMGLSLMGAVEFGSSWMGVGQSLVKGNGMSSSFFTGVLAAVVASPCTAPFMATAVGFAVTQDAFSAISVFAALGFGLAFPFLALSYSPAVAKHLPAPGAWMETLKQLLAFPLFLTSAWLLLVLGAQTSSDGSAFIMAGCTAIAFGFWLFKQSPKRAQNKFIVKALAIASLVLAAYTALNIKDHSEREMGLWISYDRQSLNELRDDGKAVFIDLTADWCITCKVNERIALTEKVDTFAAENNITLMQGDWTKKNAAITALLKEHKRNGVPLYLMYPARKNGEPEVLPQVLTESSVIEAMKRAQ